MNALPVIDQLYHISSSDPDLYMQWPSLRIIFHDLFYPKPSFYLTTKQNNPFYNKWKAVMLTIPAKNAMVISARKCWKGCFVIGPWGITQFVMNGF